MILRAPLSFLSISISCIAHSASLPQEQLEFFEQRVRPVLARECYECHSTAGKKKGGLLLDHRAGWQAGGESGAVILPGDARKSLLIQTIRHEHADLHMPKDGAKLDGKTIADLERWITMGAPDPRDAPPTKDQLAKATSWDVVLAERKKWWSLMPVRSPQSSALSAQEKSGANPIDAFIQARLRENGLTLSPPADAATLLRRLHFTLTGLPPTAAESKIPNLESKIQDLLQSPRFGEKWARHWMDWLRYAETHGSEGDTPIPYASRYRDYLIRAFNADVPYPQLIREAIAGDLLSQPRVNRDLGINESALGIAQLRMVLHGFSPVDSLDELVAFTDNQIDTVTKAFQAMTVSCARCHNHKFDAISQADFYSLYGVFSSTHPAVIDVSATDDSALRDEMRRLKTRIKETVGRSWLAALGGTDASHETHVSRDPNLRWFASGKGISATPTPAGEFSVSTTGSLIIERIHPRGWFSDLISTKDRAVLMSPRFRCEGGTLWMRAAGGGESNARYIVQNYPRTGTIHKATEFKNDADASLGWRKLDLEYWKGDEIFIQCATAADLPVQTKLDARSWFGITDWRVTKADAAPPEIPKPATNARAAVTAWLAGKMTDAQAELLDSLLRAGKLANDTTKLAEVAPLLKQYREVESKLTAPVRAPGVLEADATDRPLFVRGDHKQPAEIIPRRFLDAIDPTAWNPKDSGRLQLANHIADMQANPLTARVMVNRIWHHLFGRGIVPTTDNFGRLGDLPSHPELLDYLAARFTATGGSIKDIICLIVTSKTFQQSSQASETQNQKPELLPSFPIRRLEAEAIRDSMLALSGRLDLTMFGDPVNDDTPRRSVYMKIIRNQLDPLLTIFDAPVPSGTRGRRDATNVPAQSLALLNDTNVINWARNWARDVLAETSLTTDEQRVARMFQQAFGRPPSTGDTAQSLAFIRDSLTTGDQLRSQLVTHETETIALRAQLDGIMSEALRLLEKKRGTKPGAVLKDIPQPLAEWDFEDGGADLRGNLPLTLHGNARIADGALVLDGGKSFASTGALPVTLDEKTLEAWVRLDDDDQRGAGVLTVQTQDGLFFDSIVFAEKAPGEWLAGSNNFSRTHDFGGAADAEATQRAVHLAITYKPDGTIEGWRNGTAYGEPYKSDGPYRFIDSKSQIIFGVRHGQPGGNRVLRGKIFRARLHDRALTADEIARSAQIEQGTIPESVIIASLNEKLRTEVLEMKDTLRAKEKHLADSRALLNDGDGREIGWSSLAQAMFNMKEFIYLR